MQKNKNLEGMIVSPEEQHEISAKKVSIKPAFHILLIIAFRFSFNTIDK